MKVIVTGASRGIGRGIAEVLAAGGHQLGLIARSELELNAMVETLPGGPHASAPADLRRFEPTHAAVERIVQQLGGVDALVNNAGVVVRKPIGDLSVEEWQTMLETNLSGVFYATKSVLPHLLRQRRGHVVNISSISGYFPLPGGSAYAASKYGVTGFSESLLGEVRESGVRVTTVFPGSVDTESHAAPGADGSWKLQPEDVGQAVRYAIEAPPHVCVSRVEVRPLSRPR